MCACIPRRCDCLATVLQHATSCGPHDLRCRLLYGASLGTAQCPEHATGATNAGCKSSHMLMQMPGTSHVCNNAGTHCGTSTSACAQAFCIDRLCSDCTMGDAAVVGCEPDASAASTQMDQYRNNKIIQGQLHTSSAANTWSAFTFCGGAALPHKLPSHTCMLLLGPTAGKCQPCR